MKNLLVTPEEYFKAHGVSTLSKEQWYYAIQLLTKLNMLRLELGIPFVVTSGFRPASHNVKIGGSTNSNHIKCAAVDIADIRGTIYAKLTDNNNALLEKYDLYLEDRRATPSWTHISILPPRSGRRIFIP